jgi:hypothetical protein
LFLQEFGLFMSIENYINVMGCFRGKFIASYGGGYFIDVYSMSLFGAVFWFYEWV